MTPILTSINRYSMQLLIVVIFLTFLRSFANSLYFDGESNVIRLTVDNYTQVYESKELWIINYYSPASSQSQEMISDYKHLSLMFEGLIKVGAMNCDIKHYFCKHNGVNTLPLIRYYGIEHNYSTYYGNHLLGDLVQASRFAIDRRFHFRLGVEEKKYKQILIELTDTTFDDYVLHSDHTWIVEFFTENSGILKNFIPIYERLARQVRKDNIYCAIISADRYRMKVKEYGVSSLPTFKYFPPGLKSRHSAKTYMGELDRLRLMEWVTELHQQTIPIPTVYQMISQNVTLHACFHKVFCIFTMMPLIEKCNSTCRLAYLDIVQEVARRLKRNNWGWLWMAAGTQPDWEQMFMVKRDIEIPRIFVFDSQADTYWTDEFEPFAVDTVVNYLQNHDSDHTKERPCNMFPGYRTIQLWDGGETDDVKTEDKKKPLKDKKKVEKNEL